MKFQKFFTLAFSCLFVLDTSFTSLAASVPSSLQNSSIIANSQEENLKEETTSFSKQNTNSPEESTAPRKEEEETNPSNQSENPSGETNPSNQSENPSGETNPSNQSENPSGEINPSNQNEIPLEESNASSEDLSEETNKPSNITLNYTSHSLTAGDTLQLTTNTGSSNSITWDSDHSDIASITSTGVVTAHKAGSAIITAFCTFNTEAGPITISASCTITVKNTISLDKKTLSLYTNETKKLKASATPTGTITWKSSKPNIAKVDKDGTISPKKAGTTTITASVNGVTASCKVTVKKPSLKLKAKTTVYLKNPIVLDAKTIPKNPIKWKSSDNKIASIDSNGKLKPKKCGTITITASCNGLKKSCKVTVKKPSIKIATKSKTLFTENTYQLKASAKPDNQITWSSSDPKIAKINKNGTITGLKVGTTTITASVAGAKTSCKITILKNNYKLNRTSQTLMKGNSTTLYLNNVSAKDTVSFELEDPSSQVVKISTSGNSCKVTAKKEGTVTLNALCSSYVDNKLVTCTRSCTIKVIKSGVKQQQFSLAVKTKKALTLKNIQKPDTQIKSTIWSSSAPNIASVSKHKGVVTGKKVGSAKITATVTYTDGTSSVFPTSIKISNPKVSASNTLLTVGKTKKIKVQGLTSYSNIKWNIKDSSLASIDQNGTVTAKSSTGKTTIIITADGKKIKHPLIITNPQLKTTHITINLKEHKKFPLTGTSSSSKVTYKSKKSSVATVSKSGTITGRSYGDTKITATVDGKSFHLKVKVTNKRAENACKIGYQIINSSTYSQARRMTEGYYDCSSLVFRSYGCDSALLGGQSTWAPTAASMAAHLETAGKVISYTGIDASQLLPGDLIFYSKPNGSNGRYKNIHHVSMYYGDGYRLEKPLRLYRKDYNIVMIARPIQ